jgi:hypothetical protein
MESVNREEERREYPCANCSCLEEFRPYSEIIAYTQYLRYSLLNRNAERDAMKNFETLSKYPRRKTDYVVFKYLSRWVELRLPSLSPLYFPADLWIFNLKTT